MAFENRPVATATVFTPTATELKLSDGTLTLDSTRYPYAEARVTVPMPSPALLEVLKPGTRVQLDASAQGAIQANLHLVSREASEDGKELRLNLASDEALLEAWAPLRDDDTPRNYESSLRSIVNYVLGKVSPGASLQSGTTNNANLTAYWPITNLMVNPSVVGSSLGYQAGPNTSSATFSTAYGYVGSSSMAWVSDSAATALLHCRSFRVQPGRTYVMSAYATTGLDRRVRMMARFRDDDGNVLMDKYGPLVTASGLGNWDRVTYIVTVPKGASNLSFNIGLVANVAGQTTYADAFMFYEGDELVPYFDGYTTPSGYVTQWQDVANASASERIPLVERPRELFTWTAGQSAWDFLENLTSAAGLRLFCDEKRRWFLVDPASYRAPGTRISARADNTVEATDTMDALDEETGVTGVIARFSWVDRATGEDRTRDDYAGTNGKVKLLEFERPYSAGVAAAHLKKVKGVNRRQDVVIGIDYGARPSTEIQIDLPSTEPQIGTLTRVQFELTTGLMSLQSGGLREAPVGSIDLLPGSINSLTGSIDSLT